jgi:hypothetical protein
MLCQLLVGPGVADNSQLLCGALQLEVFPEEEIRLVNANQVPDDDYASVFDGVAGMLTVRLLVDIQQGPGDM